MFKRVSKLAGLVQVDNWQHQHYVALVCPTCSASRCIMLVKFYSDTLPKHGTGQKREKRHQVTPAHPQEAANMATQHRICCICARDARELVHAHPYGLAGIFGCGGAGSGTGYRWSWAAGCHPLCGLWSLQAGDRCVSVFLLVSPSLPQKPMIFGRVLSTVQHSSSRTCFFSICFGLL